MNDYTEYVKVQFPLSAPYINFSTLLACFLTLCSTIYMKLILISL